MAQVNVVAFIGHEGAVDKDLVFAHKLGFFSSIGICWRCYKAVSGGQSGCQAVAATGAGTLIPDGVLQEPTLVHVLTARQLIKYQKIRMIAHPRNIKALIVDAEISFALQCQVKRHPRDRLIIHSTVPNHSAVEDTGRESSAQSG